MKKLLMIMLAIISYGINAQNSPGVYTVKNAKINTDNSDFGTAFFGDDKVVFAAPKQGLTFNREEYHNQPFLDLYIGEVTEDGQIIKKQKLPGDINTKYHEGMVAFTKDMKTVYFSANNYVKKKKGKKKSTSYIQLFVANITEEGEWTNMKMVPFNSDKFSTGHPVLNRDDSKLYFVSDRPESIGKTDIFVVDVYEDGSFSEPRNLGPKINTPERDMFPFIGKDNVLYFSSDGYRGHGELDVYASKIFDSTVSTPINLEEPVNSEHDDFAYIIDDHKHRGYFSSNREGGHGDDDIYSFVASPPIYIECKQAIAGVVKDIDTQELIPDVLIILYDAKGIELQSFISSKDEGSFSFQQSCNTTYTIKGFLEGYLIGEMDIKTVNDLDAAPIEIILNLISDPNKQEEVIAEANSSEKEDKSMLGSNEDESTGLSSSSELERVDEKADQKSKGETTVTENTSKTEIASAAAVVSTKNESETVDAEVAVNTSKKKTVTAATPAAVVTTKTESETVDAEVVINAEDKQQEMTSATLEEQETQAQKAIAMDTSEAGQTLEDETGDSETKKSNESPIHIECKQAIAGVVKDIDTQELIPDVLIILYDAKGIELQSFISSKDEGSFSFQQSCNTTYTIKGFLEGYLIGEMDIKTVNDLDAAPIEIILNLISDPNKQEEVIAEANSSEKEDKSMLGSNEDESTGLSSSSELERVDEKADQKSKGETTVTENTSKTEIASAAAVVSTKNESETVDAEVAVNTSKKKTVTAATPAAVVTTKTESETVDAEVVINAEDKQQEMTSATLEEQETQAQKAIAMDTSEAGQTLEDETGDSETKKSSESPIHINTIYFDFDKYDIRFDARIELDKIAEVLKQNPKTKIKVDAHTDIRGKRAYNLKLSDSRAYKTVQYLLDMGIEVERISGKGHGETQVVEKCTKQEPCTGLQHQLNRRAEFLIVDKFSDAIIAQSFNKAASGNYALNDKVTNSGAYVNYDFSNNRAVYTVQLGAFKGEVQNNKFSKLTDLFNYRYDDGLNRYYAGIFESSIEARNYMRKMRKNGFGDAFVVGLKGESRF